MQTLTFLSRLSLVTLVGFIFSVIASTHNVSAQSSSTELIWQLSYQQETSAGSGRFHRLQKPATWQAKQTAIIVCDMWDLHHCHRAVLRGGELAPRLNAVLEEARSRGVTIIHAPSSCMDAYANHPARVRAQAVSIVSPLPEKITEWCYKIPAEEQGTYPIDQSNGGEDDEAEEHAQWAAHLTSLGRNPKAPWKSQMKEITIHDDVDYISDRGDEIWSILQSRGIEHVILTGVHVNMCVLGRPFGLRQLVRAGKDAVLMRDMTDTMYDPNCKPFVSHFTGTDLIIDHIERHVCPTISSNQLIGGQEFRFKDDKRPTVAILMAEDEYKTETTLPPWSINQLGKKYRLRWIFGSDGKRYHIPGIEAVKDADLLIVSARRRPLPAEELAVVRAFAGSGKPMLGIRTASHAFSLRTGSEPGTESWPEFDREIWGGSYTNHYGNNLKPTITTLEPANNHPILKGWGTEPFVSSGSLYKVSPLHAGTQPLLTGAIPDQPAEPTAWTYRRAVDRGAVGGHSFYTSLGHADDFGNERFAKFLASAVDWLIEQK